MKGEEQRGRICGCLISGEAGVGEKGGGDLNGSGKAHWAYWVWRQRKCVKAVDLETYPRPLASSFTKWG